MTALAYSIDALPAADPLRVALLSDRPGTLHFLERELRARGLEVRVARSDHELIAWLREGRGWVDAALVDLCHQSLNALSLLRQLADEFPAVRRVAIADASPRLLRRLAGRFGRTSLVIDEPLDSCTVESLLAALNEVVFVGAPTAP